MAVAMIVAAQPDRDRIRFRQNNELFACDLGNIDCDLRMRGLCREDGEKDKCAYERIDHERNLAFLRSELPGVLVDKIQPRGGYMSDTLRCLKNAGVHFVKNTTVDCKTRIFNLMGRESYPV
jgi:hypothetical protein